MNNLQTMFKILYKKISNSYMAMSNICMLFVEPHERHGVLKDFCLFFFSILLMNKYI